MKKIVFTLFLLVLSIGLVSADEVTEVPMTGFYRDFDKVITDVEAESSKYQALISLYHSTYEQDYPYFLIRSDADYRIGNDVEYIMTLFSSSVDVTKFSASLRNSTDLVLSYNNNIHSWGDIGSKYYHTYNSTLTSIVNNETMYIYSVTGSFYSPVIYSNFDIPLPSDSGYAYQFPPLANSTHNISFQFFELQPSNIYPSYLSLYEGDYAPSISYTPINLNDYSYVALSLKNYSRTSPFSTNFIVEGQLCITPVYNYGMSEKQGAGYQVDRCSPVYTTATPMRIDVIQSDIDNKSIFYLKAYNTSIPNVIQVDNSIFNITYITNDEEQPYVNVNGVQYPTIPYDNLSSTATLSEEQGYVSGQVQNIFDVSEDSDFIEELFNHPINSLKKVFSTIVVMFSLIGTFIDLLPVTMQGFLYVSFSLGIVLGLLKMLV